MKKEPSALLLVQLQHHRVDLGLQQVEQMAQSDSGIPTSRFKILVARM
eukprot:SAG31_NODE_1786_length_7271_cov_6.872492_3_plen_48_part_00